MSYIRDRVVTCCLIQLFSWTRLPSSGENKYCGQTPEQPCLLCLQGGRTPPINLSFDMFFVSVSQGYFGLYWSLFLTNISFHMPNWIVAIVDWGWMNSEGDTCCSGVNAVFYGSDLIEFFFLQGLLGWKVQERPCKRLESCSSSCVMETAKVEHLSDTIY